MKIGFLKAFRLVFMETDISSNNQKGLLQRPEYGYRGTRPVASQQNLGFGPYDGVWEELLSLGGMSEEDCSQSRFDAERRV